MQRGIFRQKGKTEIAMIEQQQGSSVKAHVRYFIPQKELCITKLTGNGSFKQKILLKCRNDPALSGYDQLTGILLVCMDSSSRQFAPYHCRPLILRVNTPRNEPNPVVPMEIVDSQYPVVVQLDRGRIP